MDRSGSRGSAVSPWSLAGAVLLEHLFQPSHQLRLRRVHQRPGALDVEPPTTVHLRKCDPPPRLSRPFDGGGVAHDRRLVSVALPGPGVDDLPGLLPHAAQVQVRAPRLDARLLPELANSGVERLLSRLDPTLRDRPRPLLPVPPEWSTRVRQEDLQLSLSPSEQEESRADFGHGRGSVVGG